jgi:hypothetical protein
MSFNVPHRLHRVDPASAVLTAMVATIACGTPAPGATDSRTPDAREGSGGVPGVRLNCTLGSTPTLPVTLGNVTVNTVRFSIRSIKVVGDAGSDARAQKQDLDLRWQSGVAPTPQAFDNFPPGIYSGFTTKIDSDLEEAYVFTGVVNMASQESMPFVLYDSESFSQTLPLSLSYQVGDSVDLDLKADLAGVINAINFSNLEDVGGVLEFGANSEIDKAYAAMKRLFSMTVR